MVYCHLRYTQVINCFSRMHPMSKKLSAATVTAIKTALYSCASATSVWAGDMSYFKHLKATGRQITEYGYRDRMLNVVPTAQLIEGPRLHKPATSVYPVTLVEMLEAMQTSLIHHQRLEANTYSLTVGRLEKKMAEILKPVAEYLDIHLGESDDKFHSVRRRDVLISVKPEYRDSISVSVKHSILNNASLKETISSFQERRRRETFID